MVFILTLLEAVGIESLEIYSVNIFSTMNRIYLINFLAGIFFLIGAITDFLDGYLAKKWNIVSDFGKIYDPIADKFLILSIVGIFTFTKNIYIFFAIPLLVRDISMDCLRLFLSKRKKIVAASNLAKWKTATQMIGLILIFFVFKGITVENKDFLDKKFWISQIIILLSLIFSYLSFFQYVKKIYENN